MQQDPEAKDARQNSKPYDNIRTDQPELVAESLKQIILHSRSAPAAANELLDELLAQPWLEQNPDAHVRALLSKAEVMRLLKSDTTREKYLLKGLALTEEHGLTRLRGDALNAIGLLNYYYNKLAPAHTQLKMALEIALEVDYPPLIANVYNSLTIVSNKLCDYGAALRYGLDSYELYRKLGNDRGQGTALSNISSIYIDLREHDTSIKYSERALQHRLKANDLVGAHATCMNLSVCWFKKREHDKAIRWLDEAEELVYKARPDDIPIVLSYQSYVRARAGRARQAERYLRRALEVEEGIAEFGVRHDYNLYLANTYHLLGNHVEAERRLKILLALDSTNFPSEDAQGVHRLMYDVLMSLGRNAEAQHHLRLYSRIREDDRSRKVIAEVFAVNARRDVLNSSLKDQNSSRIPDTSQQDMRNRLQDTLHSHVRSAEVLQSIRKEITKIMPELDSDAASIAQTTLGTIEDGLERLKHSPLPEGFLEQQHHEFIKKLHNTAPNLTPTELRVCVLLHLKFKSKDMAQMLSSSTATIGAHRKNIRKKLSLEPGVNLTSFLLTL